MSMISKFGRTATALTALILGFAACDGENLFQSGGTVDDSTGPVIAIESPDSGQRVAIGDSVRVSLRASDEQGLASIEITGVALSGSAQLGTLTATTRFATKIIQFTDSTRLVRDTLITRYLLAAGDSVEADSVLLIARATDQIGNASADTLRIEIGGPRVQISSPVSGTTVLPGAALLVRLVAADSANLLQSILLSARGQFSADTVLTLDPPVTRVDTIVALNVPVDAPTGSLQLIATVRNTLNDSTLSVPVDVTVLPPAADTNAPVVTFTTSAPARAEQRDSVRVTVSATDDIRVDSVGVTLLGIRRLATSTDTLQTITRAVARDSATFVISLADLGVPVPTDSSTIRIEITGFGIDSSSNCAAVTVPSTPLSEPCVIRGGYRFGTRSGAITEILSVRGTTARPAVATDRLADLALDETGRRVFVTNFSRNRLEVLPFGQLAFSGSIQVGSEPWGITLGVAQDTLFVANSGGTNISVVPLSTLQEDQTSRIRPADIRLYSLDYDVVTDSVDVVNFFDYSDRPQFIGQISSGQLIYSTVPTATRDPGTIRIIDPNKDQTRDFNRGSEIFVNYARTESGTGIVVNALSAGLSQGRAITVCPRRISGAGADPACITGTATAVRNQLATLRSSGLTDTRIDLGRNIDSVPLTDTTFVAVSRDNSTIAFGEGAANPGRVFLFQNSGGTLLGSSTQTDDLVGNAAERVIGLALNGDGSLGGARGNRAYFFDRDLRQEGIATISGSPTGGIALHPANVGYPTGTPALRLGFVSAQASNGLPYIEIVNTFTFQTIRRVFIRDRIVGTLAAAQVQPGDPGFGTVALRLYGITTTGVVEIELTSQDLQ